MRSLTALFTLTAAAVLSAPADLLSSVTRAPAPVVNAQQSTLGVPMQIVLLLTGLTLLPVLVMSMHDESLYAERALRAGAKGYVMKHEASDRILTAIRSVLAGDLYLSEKMKEKMLHRLVRSRKNEVVFTIDTLSDREMEVFQLIGNGFGTRQIADKLNLSVKTIDSYREHLKLKLRLEKGSDLVRHAIQWVRSEGVV